MENLDVALPHVHVKVRDAATKEIRVQRIRVYGEQSCATSSSAGDCSIAGTDIRVPAASLDGLVR